jgi:RNA polymerase sigma-70 factor, ECF subfamily
VPRLRLFFAVTLGCVFFPLSSVCIDTMNASACYFVNGMERESTAIARGLRRRDPDLLDRLIEQYQHRLMRYLAYLVGNRQTAEDLFQDTWLRVLERGSQYDPEHNFSTWLFSIARHLAIDHLRRKKPVSLELEGDDAIPAALPVSNAPSAFDMAAGLEQSEQILAALANVQVEYREAIVLRFHEDLSLEEIAAVTHAPLGTVKSRIYRGLNALMPRLKGVLG